MKPLLDSALTPLRMQALAFLFLILCAALAFSQERGTAAPIKTIFPRSPRLMCREQGLQVSPPSTKSATWSDHSVSPTVDPSPVFCIAAGRSPTSTTQERL